MAKITQPEFVFHTRFNPPESPSLKCEDASLTRQEFVEESDINNIMKRYASGLPLPSGDRQPVFDDFSDVPDYATAFEIVQRSEEAFAQLPSAVRERFANNPQQLLAFLQDEKNRDEAVKLGLIEKQADVKPADVKPAVSVSVPEKGASDEAPPTTTT